VNSTSELVEKALVLALSLAFLAAMSSPTVTTVAQLASENRRLQLARVLVEDLDLGISQVASGRAESYARDILYPELTTVRAAGFTLTVECTALGRTFTESRTYSAQLSTKGTPQPGLRTVHFERANFAVQICWE